jgi:hypothetical protein
MILPVGQYSSIPSWKSSIDELCFIRPHRSEPRWVQSGQLIHESVFDLIRDGYKPLALIRDGTPWNDVHLLKEELTEPDLFSNAKILMNKLGEKSDISEEDSQALLTLLASGEQLLTGCFLLSFSLAYPGVDRKAIYDAKNVTAALLHVLRYKYEKTDRDADQQQRLLELLFDTLSECHPTEGDRSKFSTLGLKGSMLKTAIENPTTRDVISKLLTIFTGEC